VLARKYVVERTDCRNSNKSPALVTEVLFLHCFTMRVVKTPDSAVPSLAESSPASTDTNDVTRVLFDIDTPEQKSRTTSPRVHWPNQDGTDRDSIFSSDVSVASLVLSIGDASSIVEGEHPGNSRSSTSHKPHQLVSGSKPDLQRSKVGDDVLIEPSCHGGLNLSPTEVAKIFNIFDDSQRQWSPHQAYSEADCQPPSSTSEISTTVTSNMGFSTGKSTQREKSLEHECMALKEILRVDSENILKLKGEQENLRADDSEHKIEIRLLQLELDAAKREKELQQERESQHLETIKILKDEVDNLTKVGSVWSRKKIEQMRLENELFASQIIENEAETKEIRSSLKLLLVENEEIRSDLAFVRGEQGVQYKTTSDQVEEVGNICPKTDLAKQVESLELRLQAMEKAREWTTQSLGEKSRRREEPGFPQDMIRSEAPVELSSDKGVTAEEDRSLEAGSEAQEVEVTLQGPVEKQTTLSQQGKSAECPKKTIQDDDGWNGLCDCFPPTSQNEV
jgi:hypothetical protein